MNYTALLSMTWADYTIIGIITFSVLISLMRGFVREAISLASWVIAFWIALRFNEQLSSFLTNYVSTPSLRIILSFGLLFIFTLIIGSLLGFLLSRLVISTGLTGTDKLLGLIFGLTRGVLIIGVALLLLSFTAFTQDDWYKNSVIIPHFQSLIEWLKGFLPDTMKQISSIVTKTSTQNL